MFIVTSWVGARQAPSRWWHSAGVRDSGSCCADQFRDTDQVVGCGCESEGPSDFFEPSVFCFSEARDGLHPAEAFLDAFADSLADGIARMTGCATVDGRTAAGVLRDVRRHVDLAQLHHKVRGVEALVAAQGDWLWPVGAWFNHVERGQPFGMA